MNALTLAHKKVVSPAAVSSRIPSARRFDLSKTATSGPLNSSHQFEQLSVNNPSLSPQDCPMSIANPRACPTGGVCHLCPGRN